MQPEQFHDLAVVGREQLQFAFSSAVDPAITHVAQMGFARRNDERAEGGLHLAASSAGDRGVEDLLIGSVEGVAQRAGNPATSGQALLRLGQTSLDSHAGGYVAAAVASETIGDGEDEADARFGLRLSDGVLCRRCDVWRLAIEGDPAKSVLIVIADVAYRSHASVLDGESSTHS